MIGSGVRRKILTSGFCLPEARNINGHRWVNTVRSKVMCRYMQTTYGVMCKTSSVNTDMYLFTCRAFFGGQAMINQLKHCRQKE